MNAQIPRPGAFHRTPFCPIRHPDKHTILVKTNGKFGLLGPAKGIAIRLSAEQQIFSTNKRNTFTWI